MRVQATETTPSYSMGKNKKHKIPKAKEASDSSDDGAVTTCNHVNMSVNFAQMKKGLSKQTFGECVSCSKDSPSSRRPDRSGDSMTASAMTTEDNLLGETETTMWVCLQCGNQGCDRNSYEKHALKHYETPRSSIHCIVVNTSTWSTWCYKCDDAVPIEKNKKMQECVDFLRKQSGLPVVDAVKRTTSFGATESSSVEQVKETSNRPLTPKTPTPGICHKLKGLSNLGNTCFFNAVMQNLTQTQCLENLVQDRSRKGKVVHLDGKQLSDSDESSDEEESKGDSLILKELSPIEIILPEAGALTQSMLSFLQEMNNSSNRSSTVNPSALFSQICKKAQRFRGFQQQDSHELLRYLLDSMKTEEIKRSQQAILKYFKLQENVNPKKVPEDTKIKVKEYGRQVKHTFVDSMFGGHLLSTVVCEECKHISQIFEPFLDLSLPVTEEKPPRPNQAQGTRKKDTLENVLDDNSGATCAGNEGGKSYKSRSNKQEMKKQKRQAKRESRKKKNMAKNKAAPASEAQEREAEEEDNPEEDDDDEDENKKSEDQKSGELEDNSSDKDDTSDADIEDNLESDASRCNPFSVLSMDTSVSDQTLNHDLTISTTSLPDKTTDSPLTSSTSTLQADSHSSNFTDVPNTDSNHTLNEMEFTVSINSNHDNINDVHDNDIIKPKIITNATLDEGHGVVVNGIDLNGDQTLNLSRLDNLCNGTGEENLKSQYQGSADVNGLDLHGKLSVLNDTADIPTVSSAAQSFSPEKDHKSAKIDINRNNTHDELMNASLEKLTINGVLDTHELTSKLENLHINSEIVTSNSLSSDQIDENHLENENTSKQHEMLKHVDEENLQKKNMKSSPPLSRQGSAKHSNSKKDFKKEAQLKSTTMLGSHYLPSSRECSIMSCLHQFTSAELLTGNNKFGCANCTKIRDRQHPNSEKKEMVYSCASKYYLIQSPPPILTLHLKRFEQVGFTSRKVNRHVDFPFVLDLAPFCSSLCQGVKPGQKKILYSLYGVVEHSGRLNAGHYTAYVKVRPNIGLISNFYSQALPSVKEYIQRYSERIINGSREGEVDIDEVQEEKLVPPGRWYHISDSRVSEATESTVQRAQAYLLFYERIY